MSLHTRCKHALFIPLITALCCLMISSYAQAMVKELHSDTNKHLLLVLVPEFSFAELPELITQLDSSVARDLQFGAMSMRTARGMNLVNNLFTLSTGEPAVGIAGWSAYHQEEEFQGEKASQKYTQWAGKKSDAPILHPAVFQLHNYWQKQGLSPELIGWLGQALKEQGIFISAFGNSDTLEQKQRLAPTFVMDRFGESQGMVNETILSTDAYFPTGKKTDWTVLSTELESIWREHHQSFITVELGDLVRINAEQDKMAANYLEKVRLTWFADWADWLEGVVVLAKEQELELEIWVLSPMVSNEAKKQGKMLAPFLTWSKNQGNALLTSLTTKQEGIIANLDLVPTLLAYFELESTGINLPKPLVGQEIRSSNPITIGQSENLYAWLNHLDYLFLIYQARRDVITTYIIIVICLLLLTTGYWWWERTKHRATEGIRLASGGVLLSPLFYLWLTPLIVWLKPWQWIVILLLLSMVASWIVRLFCRDDALYLAVLGLINTVFIIVDVWQGSPLMKRSFLGYDPIVGARFYGIGNEYAGFLLGSSLLAVIAFTIWLTRRGVFHSNQGQRIKQIYLGIILLFLTCVLYLLSAPQYGTNFGATLASGGAYLFLLFSLFSLRWNWKWLVVGLTFVTLLFAAFFYTHLAAEHTHLGAALSLIIAGDWNVFLDIVQRKWQMNLRLIRVSLWGKLFVTSLFVLAIVLFRLKSKQKFTQPDLWLPGFRVMVLGSILILLVNDSGIVAAATTMLYVTFPFLYLRFS